MTRGFSKGFAVLQSLIKSPASKLTLTIFYFGVILLLKVERIKNVQKKLIFDEKPESVLRARSNFCQIKRSYATAIVYKYQTHIGLAKYTLTNHM
jgi:hypothetical protein